MSASFLTFFSAGLCALLLAATVAAADSRGPGRPVRRVKRLAAAVCSG